MRIARVAGPGGRILHAAPAGGPGELIASEGSWADGFRETGRKIAGGRLGMARKPPVWLQPVDKFEAQLVEVQFEAVATLVNPVVEGEA